MCVSLIAPAIRHRFVVSVAIGIYGQDVVHYSLHRGVVCLVFELHFEESMRAVKEDGRGRR